MKSLASSEISLKASSSKSYLATVTLAMVSMSVSPMNGDRPDNLENGKYISLHKSRVNSGRNLISELIDLKFHRFCRLC